MTRLRVAMFILALFCVAAPAFAASSCADGVQTSGSIYRICMPLAGEDSSHVSKAGSDLNHIVFELLPRLAPGVFVHFHDVPYPFEYPQEWFALRVSWNEAYILRAFLQYNTKFPIRFWNDFMMKFHAEAIQELMPLCADPPAFGVGGSLWLQRA